VKGWKVQKFFGDLVYDLRTRNLLPVVIMLAVGIVAVPFLISRGSNNDSSVSLGPTASAAAPSPLTENAVVAYHPPGLRNAKKRLNDLGPKNPFIQQFTGGTSKPGGGSTTLDGVLPVQGSIPGLNTPSSGSGGTGGSGGSGGGKGGNGSSGGKTQTVYTYYVTDVTVNEAGGTPAPINNVRQFQFLPNDARPVLVYLGTASAGKQALFLVSKNVTSVGGNGVCFPSADACQLLGLNAGAGADLLYGPDGKTYHLQVTKIKRVNSSQPPG
jgi:hypothetical protein